jgi:hypothetical protein
MPSVCGNCYVEVLCKTVSLGTPVMCEVTEDLGLLVGFEYPATGLRRVYNVIEPRSADCSAKLRFHDADTDWIVSSLSDEFGQAVRSCDCTHARKQCQ